MIYNTDFRKYKYLFSKDAYVVSDPPYNQSYHYSTYKDNLEIDEYGDMLRDSFSGQKSVIISYPEETINIISKIMDDDICQQCVSWIYNSNTAKQSRLISWWNCQPDMKKIRQPYKNPRDKRIKKRIEEGNMGSKLYDWWNINQVKNVSKKNNPHPCPIPYEIAEKIILLTSEEGDTIIDPFAGSGTVCLAAKNNNRKYIGFEIDKNYFDYMKFIGL